jgi:hypothetical protein
MPTRATESIRPVRFGPRYIAFHTGTQGKGGRKPSRRLSNSSSTAPDTQVTPVPNKSERGTCNLRERYRYVGGKIASEVDLEVG